MARISAIAILGKQTRALASKGALLWHIPEDLKRLKALTWGHPLIMGRATFTAIGKPLPDRTNIVLTSGTEQLHPDIIQCTSLEEGIEQARKLDDDEIFIFGGGQVYTQALPVTDRLYLTVVDDDSPGDVFFPDYSEFTNVIEELHNEHEGLSYSFLTLERP